MFAGIKRRWAEARADVLSKDVAHILRNYQGMHGNDRYLVISAFEAVLGSLEDEPGDIAAVSDERKIEIAKELHQTAVQASKMRGNTIDAETTRLGAFGAELLALYIELLALPGEQACGLVAQIAQWRESAQQDLKIT